MQCNLREKMGCILTPWSPHPLVSSTTTAKSSVYTPHTNVNFFRCVNCFRQEITYWRKGRFLVRKWNSWESSGYRRRLHLFPWHQWIPQVTQVLMMSRTRARHLTGVFKPWIAEGNNSCNFSPNNCLFGLYFLTSTYQWWLQAQKVNILYMFDVTT